MPYYYLLFLHLVYVALLLVSAEHAPALFIFGDSLTDAGNNNYLPTKAQANYSPYGINFRHGVATGRFSDGPLISDYIANYMGLDFPPPYLSNSTNILHGVNFGSASSGILNETGIGKILSLSEQVAGFVEISKEICASGHSYIIAQSIFYITIGNNDVNNYVQNTNISQLPRDFQDVLIYRLEEQIKILYNYGARKFVMTSLSDVGCIPMNQDSNGCSKLKEAVAKNFNVDLFNALKNLQRSLKGIKIVYANLFYVMAQSVQSPYLYGLKNSHKPCCPRNASTGTLRWCLPGDDYCADPKSYMYWDEVHFSTTFNQKVAKLFWKGNTMFVYPINIKQLALY